MDRFSEIDRTIDLIAGARSITDVLDALRDAVGRLGFEWFTYDLIVPPDGPLLPFFSSSYPVAWLSRYIEKRYTRDDLVVTHAMRTVRPFLWQEVSRHPHLTAPQRLVFDEAAELGLRSGAIIPIHGPGPIKAYVSVTNNLLDDDFSRLFTAHRHSLHLVAMYAHERLLALGVGSETPSLGLSPRELEVLTWTALGNPVWRISEKLSISAHTVREYIDHAKKKLKAHDKTHAAAIALNNGLIRF